MALELPIYAIVGKQPSYAFETEDGGMNHLVWDFDKKDFVIGDADDWDALLGFGSPGGGPDTLPGATPKEGTGDLEYVTESEFWEYVDTLRPAPTEPT